MQHRYVSLDRVLAKLYRDLGITEIAEIDVIEWAGEAMELIGAVTMYEEMVSLHMVKNHQTPMPIGLHAIRMVAFNNGDTIDEYNYDKCGISANEVQQINDIDDKDSYNGDKGHLQAHGGDINDREGNYIDNINNANSAYWRSIFYIDYNNFVSSGYYVRNFTPVRLANSVYFNSLVLPEDPKIYDIIRMEYSIVDNMIRTSFKEGQVAIAYYRQKLDKDTGYPMIPDDISVVTAISAYITWKYMSRLWYLGREGYGDKMKEAEGQWHWYCKQARSKMLMPRGLDALRDMQDIQTQMIPQVDRYYGFFGNLGSRDMSLWKYNSSVKRLGYNYL